MKFLQKTLFAVLLLCTVQMSQAQYCGNSGSTICTAGTNLTQPGFSPQADSLPCAIQGVPYSQVVQVKVPTQVVYSGLPLTLNSIKIDTISNLPCGLCWATENANNTFAGGSQFCIKISGTTYDNPGQFKLHIIVDATAVVFGSPTTLTEDAGTAGLVYYIRVQSPTGTCASIDTTSPGNTATTIGTAPLATVTTNGRPLSFCDGGSVTLTAVQTGATYQWYNGGTAIANATAISYTATASGSYTVGVTAGCQRVVSTAKVVTVNTAPTASITPAGPVVLCGGGTQLLTAAVSGGTQQWYQSGTAIAAATGTTYTATATGIYYVVASQNGCTDTSNKVNVQISSSSLTPTISATSTTLCPGRIDTLDAGIGYSSYTWSMALGSGHAIHVSSPGTYSVTVTNGACSGSASVVINAGTATPTPAIQVSAGHLHLCGAGDSVVLTTTAATPLWSNLATTPSITAYGPGIYTVTSAGACGAATSAPDTVTTGATPSVYAGADTGGCTGSTIVLDAATTASSIVWSNGPTTATNSVTATGGYTVTVTQNGCSAKDSVHVSFSAAPTATFTHTGNTLTAAPGATSYQWKLNSANIPGATSQTYLVTATGNYSLEASNGYCSATSASQLITTGINDISGSLHMRIYPNPAGSELNISYTLLKEQDLEISICDMTGRLLSRLYTGTQHSGVYDIKADMSLLTSGIYIVRFKTAEGSLSAKITKE